MIPLWLWVAVVAAALMVGIVRGREKAPRCPNCGRQLHASAYPGDLCARCYLETFQ